MTDVTTGDDLGDLARQARPGPLRPQRAARRRPITDDGRIRASVPTIQALADAGARVIVWRTSAGPRARRTTAYSPARRSPTRLGELLGTRRRLRHRHGRGVARRSPSTALDDGEVALLENVRFNAGETSKDDAERGAFADQLAALADAYVSDGFGAVHRKHASVYDVPSGCRTRRAAWSRAEVEVLRRLTEDPERPYVVVLGGSKVSDKLGVIDNLLEQGRRLLIGGGMVFTFLKAQGHEVGKSLLEDDQLDTCRGYLERAEEPGVEIVLPTDIVVATGVRVRRPEPSRGRRGRRDPGRPARAWTSARSPARRSPRRSPTRRPSSGTARWASSRSRPFADGTRAVAQALTEVDGPHRRRRRRLRGGRAHARLRRGRVRPHLHRRRRQPGVPRGQELPGLAVWRTDRH